MLRIKTFSIKIIIFFLFFIRYLCAIDFSGDDLVKKSIDLFYNYKPAEAVHLLTEGRDLFPNNPRIHFTWAASRMLESESQYSVEKSYERLEGDLNEIIPVLKILSKKYKDVPEYKLYYGSAIGLKARISLGKKQWFSTFINAFRGFRIIREIEKEYPEMADAKLPIGIVEYYAGLNPGFVQWAARLFGLDATKESGLKKISIAAEKGEFSSIEAKKILAFLYLWVERDIETSKQISLDLSERYPNNFFFNIMLLECLIKSGELDTAEKRIFLLEKAIDTLTPIQKKWYERYLNYEKSQFYFLKREFDTALFFIDKSIMEYHAELDIILSHALLLKGKSL